MAAKKNDEDDAGEVKINIDVDIDDTKYMDAGKGMDTSKDMEKGKKAITKDMKIGDVLRLYPSSARVMLRFGLHCIGCHVAEWETIEQGCQAHDMTKEDIDKMIDELNSDAVLEGKGFMDEKPEDEDKIPEKKGKEKIGFLRKLGRN